ncbi:diguanylate cyclase [Pseudomonas sp. 21C1]|nr:diguanylate cyclase [Pseudomonas sp. 21C1]
MVQQACPDERMPLTHSMPHVLDLLLDAVCVVDKDGRFVFVSAAAERIFGYTPEELIGKPLIDLVLPEDRAATQQVAEEVMSGTLKPYFENRYVRKDGQVAHIMWSARWSDDHQLRIGVARDITERKRSESLQAALYAISEAAHAAGDISELCRQIHGIIAQLLPAHNFCVALYEPDTAHLSFPYHSDQRYPDSPPTSLDALPLSTRVILGGEPMLVTPTTRSAALEQAASLEAEALYWLGVPLPTQDGTQGALIIKSYQESERYSEADLELLQFVSTQVAVAIERQQLLTRLHFMAQYDQLTQLPNRRLFNDRLETALARARREQTQLALLFLDLDKFKQVNDSYGHAAGDLLLQQVAQRLRDSVRESDTVARLSGDEFVVLLERGHALDDITAVAEKIRAALDQPFDLNGQPQLIRTSIGIALYPTHGDTPQQLLSLADQAMYKAKHSGGNRVLLSE